MTTTRLRPASKSAEVLDGLRRAIMLGDLAAGAVLTELELAQRFGCSQGPVREALLALQDEGLVNRMGHRGTVVCPCTHDEAVEMFRLRHQIETRAVRRAVARIDAASIDEMQRLMAAMLTAAADEDEYELAELDRSFHLTIFRNADLPAVEPILSRCILHNQRFKILNTTDPRDLTLTAERHRSLIEAIIARDADSAAAATGHHVATIVDFGPRLFDGSEEMP